MSSLLGWIGLFVLVGLLVWAGLNKKEGPEH